MKRIEAEIHGESYELITSSENHFLLAEEIRSPLDDTHLDRNHITFYNEKGENITALYDLSGGVIY